MANDSQMKFNFEAPQLPPKKKRAIQVFEYLLSQYMKDKGLPFERRQLEDSDLKEILDSVSFIRPASRRVVACIVGVGRKTRG